MKQVKEDAPTNSAGGGAIAGIGVPPTGKGEPGVYPKRKRNKYKGVNVMRFSRFMELRKKG
jgi:hypothetical protein